MAIVHLRYFGPNTILSWLLSSSSAATSYHTTQTRQRRFALLMKEIRQKSLGCCFNCETFRLKSLCAFSPKFARSDAVHRRGNRWTDGDRCQGTTMCVARKWVPRRARGEGRARPPLRQRPTSPRRRRRPRPHSRYQRGACRGALGRCVMGTCCTAYGLSRDARARRRGAHVSYSGR